MSRAHDSSDFVRHATLNPVEDLSHRFSFALEGHMQQRLR
jgi:hypothetical protein